MNLEIFKPEHLDEIEVQDAQLSIKPHFHEVSEIIAGNGEARTIRTDRIIACGGLLWTTKGAHLWAVIARDAPMLTLHKLALRVFEVYPVHITACVETDFTAGCRWLYLLGFRVIQEVIEGNYMWYERAP